MDSHHVIDYNMEYDKGLDNPYFPEYRTRLARFFNTDTNTHTHSHRHSNSNNKANDPRAARQINWDRVPANGDRRLLRSFIYVS